MSSAGLVTVPQSDYETDWADLAKADYGSTRFDPAGARSFDNGGCDMTSDTRSTRACERIKRADVYADDVLFYRSWPVASQAKPVGAGRTSWPVHYYGMVGVGRNLPPDTGTGAELYTVIGHAPRQLDRNIALVGRLVWGIEQLSSLPRGTGALGFYEQAGERVPIRSVRLATDLPQIDRPHLQYLSTDSASFARYADARANRRDPFYLRPAGGVDICNVPVPVRKRP